MDVIALRLLLGALAWPCPAVLVGWVADRRGQSGLGWFVLGRAGRPRSSPDCSSCKSG